ncbi:MAG TPA: hypothetical protein PLG17_08055, partial [Thermodesulfobacteriota bacterium]|nr:hypothetical protein [Thermodesulfobacteriota bacterium]HNU72297.1 hypothetical protein [Thermodesulfobacteriota bacterium]HOC39092.1 hypothetical protein [Thermodesulfobacteriota bacterium]HQO78452.1 hypothetical protein [Thermodesulfobacteriota bacterium]
AWRQPMSNEVMPTSLEVLNMSSLSKHAAFYIRHSRAGGNDTIFSLYSSSLLTLNQVMLY